MGLDNSSWILDYRAKIERKSRLFFEKGGKSTASYESLQKFSPEGIALPFPGWSIVYFIRPQDDIFRLLQERNLQFVTSVTSSGIVNNFVFLPTYTYHMTLVDIATHVPAPIEQEIISRVDECFAFFKKERVFPPRMRIRGDLIPSTSTTIFPVEPLDKQSLDTIWSIRYEIRKRLHPLGDDIVQDKADSFSGHITTSYMLLPFSEIEFEEIKKIFRNNERIPEVGTVLVDLVSLYNFKTMIDWGKPISSLLLKGM